MAARKKFVPPATEAPIPGRFNYDKLDRILHEKARLGILTCLLSRVDGLSFNDLKELCALTDGNLSRHLEVLHEAGLVEIRKSFQNKRPLTVCLLTEAGRLRFQDYLDELERVIHDAQAAVADADARASSAAHPRGWSPA